MIFRSFVSFLRRPIPCWLFTLLFLYAALISLLIVELSWALLLLPLGRVTTGLLLLMAFYFISGLVHSHLLNRLNNLLVWL